MNRNSCDLSWKLYGSHVRETTFVGQANLCCGLTLSSMFGVVSFSFDALTGSFVSD